jgi:heme exporter protein A
MIETVSVLQAKDLECLRGECLLFSRLNFEVGEGQVLQVEGANGSGKTSLLRILAGLSPPSEGVVLWRGENILHYRPAFFSEVAYMGHHLGLKAELSVVENLRFGWALNGLPHDPLRLGAALAKVGLAERGDVPVRALSAGQRQRVALARLWASPARLWILDEPFTALDVAGVALAQDLLNEHSARGGLAVLTSHQAIEIRNQLIKFSLG